MIYRVAFENKTVSEDKYDDRYKDALVEANSFDEAAGVVARKFGAPWTVTSVSVSDAILIKETV